MKFKFNPKLLQAGAVGVGARVGGAIVGSFIATKVPESIEALKDKPQVVQGLLLAAALVGEGMVKNAHAKNALQGISTIAGMKLAASYSPTVKKQLGLSGVEDNMGATRIDWNKLAAEAAADDRAYTPTYDLPPAHDRYRPQMGAVKTMFESEEIEYLFD